MAANISSVDCTARWHTEMIFSSTYGELVVSKGVEVAAAMEASASTGPPASPQLFLHLELSDEDLAELVLSGKSDSPSSSNSDKLLHEEQEVQEDSEMRLKRERRMKSNRESARRSRMKKQMQLDILQARLEQLRSENALLKHQVSGAMKSLKKLSSGNDALRIYTLELNARLHYLKPYTKQIQPESCSYDEEPFDLASFFEQK